MIEMKETVILIPPAAESIIDKLEASGFQAFVVGGCVRDSIMGRTPDDWDICTDAKPEEMKEVFSGWRVIETGIKHGTLTILASSPESDVLGGGIGGGGDPGSREAFEVTTFRVDGDYSDNRHPDSVSFTGKIEEDLARRDFTVNAMAYSKKRGLADPFGGAEDIEKKIIRCVGDPETRFREDGLRIMRGVRFSSVLGFSIEEKTAEAILGLKSLLDNIASERIRVELDKLLCGRDAGRVLREYREVIAQIIPEVRASFGFDQQTPYHVYDVWEHTVHAVENIEPEPTLRMAALLHDIGKPEMFTVRDGRGHFYRHEKASREKANAIMRRLKYDNDSRRTVCRLIEYHGTVFRDSEKQVRKLLRDLGEENLRLLIKLELEDVKSQAPEFTEERVRRIGDFSRLVDKVIADEQCFSMKDLAVDGRDMIDMGIKQGPEIGTVLSSLLDKVLEGDLPNEKDILLQEAENMMKRS